MLCRVIHAPSLAPTPNFLLTDKIATINQMATIKTRFAPSPTGFMHVGGVRTALYAWLLARHNDGEFHLRIEDTDKAREVAGSVEHIQETLAWLGLDLDGPVIKQSDRLALYKSYADKLVDRGLAYADPYSPEQINEFRELAKTEKRPFLYRHHRPESPPTWDGTQPLRLKTPEIKPYTWHDEVRGKLSAGPDALDDFILIKSDGYPTYNFAHIVDDFEMGITHILRADEFIASTPRFLSLYDALEITPPSFATLPPILGKDGNKKLSKRDGAKDVLEYRDDGFLPETILNFLASLGWNDGTEQEVFSVKELITKFSLDRIQKSGARFDTDRLTWMSGAHIRNLTADELFQKIDEHFWPNAAHDHDDTYKKAVLGLTQERLKFFSELAEQTHFFFENPVLSRELLSEVPADRATQLLVATRDLLSSSDFARDTVDQQLHELLETLTSKPGELFKFLRIVLTASKFSPPLSDMISVMGKERVLARINTALELLK